MDFKLLNTTAPSANRPRLRSEWLETLGDTLAAPQMQSLAQFLRDEKALGKVIYPPGSEIFSALQLTPPEAVRVVILGQDPYHGPDQAHGLSFSVRKGVAIPPSLRNIFKELQRDLEIEKPSHGCLNHWAEQGVLLLNASLTVESGRAGSHQNLGWEVFTDRVVATVRDVGKPIVFMLWGAQARKKFGALDGFGHCILTAPHPSPLSAHRGFLGCGHFSQANAFLERCDRGAIDWSLPD
ncbi:MAG: uracil-DNA glycosylase [Luminiphilus sp.]|nr:uracil-DNA glycosylase [Luminiphilus sp.]